MRYNLLEDPDAFNEEELDDDAKLAKKIADRAKVKEQLSLPPVLQNMKKSGSVTEIVDPDKVCGGGRGGLRSLGEGVFSDFSDCCDRGGDNLRKRNYTGIFMAEDVVVVSAVRNDFLPTVSEIFCHVEGLVLAVFVEVAMRCLCRIVSVSMLRVYNTSRNVSIN